MEMSLLVVAGTTKDTSKRRGQHDMTAQDKQMNEVVCRVRARPTALPGKLSVCIMHFMSADKTTKGKKRIQKEGKTDQDKASQSKTRLGKPKQDKTRQHKTRLDRTGQDGTRQDKTRQDKTRQDKIRQHTTWFG